MENKLELKHIAPYLPYGLKILTYADDMYAVIQSIKNIHFHGKNGNSSIETSYGWDLEYHEFKPIIRPLSDITKDLTHNGNTFNPYRVLNEDFNITIDESKDMVLDYYEIGLYDSPYTGYNVIAKLVEWHFDVFCLIPEGLAISYKEAGL